MNPVLSILIITTPDRANLFSKLYDEIERQIQNLRFYHPSLGDVQILYYDSEKVLDGGPSIGKKRQVLLEKAAGDYIAYIDSDDYVAPNYIEEIMRAAQFGKDVISFKCIAKTDHYWSVIIMSLAHLENEQLRPGFVLRKPWHICPIKREIAQSEKFNPLNHGEDVDWLKRVIPKCRSEKHLSSILTQYNHSEQHSEADKIIQHERNNS